jgi:hypothetical protein
MPWPYGNPSIHLSPVRLRPDHSRAIPYILLSAAQGPDLSALWSPALFRYNARAPHTGLLCLARRRAVKAPWSPPALADCGAIEAESDRPSGAASSGGSALRILAIRPGGRRYLVPRIHQRCEAETAGNECSAIPHLRHLSGRSRPAVRPITHGRFADERTVAICSMPVSIGTRWPHLWRVQNLPPPPRGGAPREGRYPLLGRTEATG